MALVRHGSIDGALGCRGFSAAVSNQRLHWGHRCGRSRLCCQTTSACSDTSQSLSQPFGTFPATSACPDNDKTIELQSPPQMPTANLLARGTEHKSSGSNWQHNEVFKWVFENQVDSLLDLGCSYGQNLACIAKCCRSLRFVVGVDFSESAVKAAQKKYGVSDSHVQFAFLHGNVLDSSSYEKAVMLLERARCRGCRFSQATALNMLHFFDSLQQQTILRCTADVLCNGGCLGVVHFFRMDQRAVHAAQAVLERQEWRDVFNAFNEPPQFKCGIPPDGMDVAKIENQMRESLTCGGLFEVEHFEVFDAQDILVKDLDVLVKYNAALLPCLEHLQLRCLDKDRYKAAHALWIPQYLEALRGPSPIESGKPLVLHSRMLAARLRRR